MLTENKGLQLAHKEIIIVSRQEYKRKRTIVIAYKPETLESVRAQYCATFMLFQGNINSH